MSLFNKKSKKGFLLTLLTLVIFILMLGELITYVLVSSNYYSLAGDTSVALNSGSATLNLNTNIQQFMTESLKHALIAINSYEINSSLYNGTFINNTPSTLTILMENGTFEGNVISSMSSYTLNSFINNIKHSSASQQIFINITNASLSIYQTNPFNISATYTAIADVTSATGITTYPIHATAQIPLSYVNDLFASQHGKRYNMIPTNITAAIPITESNVINNGSTSPFMFAYGKIYYYPGKLTPTSGCATFSRSLENQNYILVAYNAVSINSTACGFGGLITNILNDTPPYKPYLDLNISVNNLTIIPIRNGTYALLDGAATSLLDISPLTSAFNTSYMYPSIYRPSYLGRAEGSQAESPGGSFYFYTPNIKVATITSPAALPSNIVNQNGTYEMNTTISRLGLNYTVSMWFDLRSISSKGSTASYGDNYKSPIFDIYNKTGFDFGSGWAGGNLTSGSGAENFMWAENYSANDTANQQNCVTENGTVQSNTWYNAIVKVFDYSKINLYLNGRLMTTCNITTNTITVASNSSVLAFAYGMNPGSTNAIANSSIANIQVYNRTLNNTLIYKMYSDGISGLPVSQNSLVYWAQLNGNINYYNGTRVKNTLQPKSISNNVRFYNVTNYSVDSTQFGINNMMNASSTYGFNCNNADNCSSGTLYLNNGKLSSGKIASMNGSADNYMNAYIGNWIDSNTNLTITAWFDSTGSGGPIFGLYSPVSSVNEALLSINSNAVIGSYFPGIGGYSLNGEFNTLYFAAITFNALSGLDTFYINGKAIGSQTGTYTPIGMNQYFTNKVTGTKPALTPDYFNGYIYSVSVYSKNLTGTQISNLYNEGPGGSPAYGVQDWWRLNGNLYDYGPQNNNGFYNGNFVDNTAAYSTETDAFGIYKGTIPTYFMFNPDINYGGGIAYINIPNLVPKSYSSFSYFGWVYATSNEIDGRTFTTSAGDSGTIELAIGNYTHPRLMVSGYGFSGWTDVGSAFKKNTWNFIGTVYNSSGAHIFLNGIDVYDSNPSESGATSGNMQIGATSAIGGANNQFFGGISDFQFYNTGLNKSEVKNLYLNNTVRSVLPYAYLPLGLPNNNTINETADITGGNFIGYLVGNVKGKQCTTENVSVGLCFVIYK